MSAIALDYSVNNKLDVYLPPQALKESAPVPAVIFFHGGGLVFGDRGQNPIFPYWLLEQCDPRAWALISADSRKFPAHNGHDMINDVKALFQYIASPAFSQAVGARLNTSRLVVLGASAGAYLARLAVLYAEPRPVALVSLYGMGGAWFLPHWTDVRADVGTFLSSRPNPMIKLLNDGVYIDLLTGVTGLAATLRELPVTERSKAIPASSRALFPELFAESFPPTLLVHGSQDSVVLLEESQATAAQLQRAGKDVRLVVVDDLEHGLQPPGPLSIQAEKDIIDFIHKHLDA